MKPKIKVYIEKQKREEDKAAFKIVAPGSLTPAVGGGLLGRHQPQGTFTPEGMDRL